MDKLTSILVAAIEQEILSLKQSLEVTRDKIQAQLQWTESIQKGLTELKDQLDD